MEGRYKTGLIEIRKIRTQKKRLDNRFSYSDQFDQ